MSLVERRFLHRVSKIPVHGVGLSVDVYSPNLFDLVEALDASGLRYGYLEVFQVPEQALQTVRSRLSQIRLECHAEGLWVTQPDWWEAYPAEASMKRTVSHLRELQCSWFNHECASKQMAGYSFGTYLPPLFTESSARVTAKNAIRLQEEVDRMWEKCQGLSPLLLLETPPLTYFAFGDIPYAEFFHILTQKSGCGLVLDIGHIWTVYRYAGYWRTHSIRDFLEEFLAVFPVSHVVQIHIAGLATHSRSHNLWSKEKTDKTLPAWVDSHHAPIPDILFDMLDRVMAHPDLVHLKGVAMEVDTKPIPVILDEYRRFSTQFSWWDAQTSQRRKEEMAHDALNAGHPRKLVLNLPGSDQEELDRYRAYARVASDSSGTQEVPLEFLHEGDVEAFQCYRQGYLTAEILEWGGNLKDMFPLTHDQLDGDGIHQSEFVSYWFQGPRPNADPYDFFLLKVQRFVEFVRSVAPDAVALAEQEAGILREGYHLANQLSPHMEIGSQSIPP